MSNDLGKNCFELQFTYNPTPKDNHILEKWLQSFNNTGTFPIVDKFKGNRPNTWWHEPQWVKVFEEDLYIGGYWDCGVLQCGDDFMQKLLSHPQIKYLNEITDICVDQCPDSEVIYKKPKQQIPYWANNWRKK
jgi:hypothetical protein